MDSEAEDVLGRLPVKSAISLLLGWGRLLSENQMCPESSARSRKVPGMGWAVLGAQRREQLSLPGVEGEA